MQIRVSGTLDDDVVPEHVRLEYEANVRLVRERCLERMREARRTAPRCYGPAVDGVIWRRVRPGEETDLGPPILSILEFPLRPDVKLLDDAAAAPARGLWDATAQYVASVPGCGGLEWGTARMDGDDGPAGRVVCWVQWESVAAWRRFQWSMGFLPVIGALAVDCSNRCAKVVGGGVPRFRGEGHGETIVDVVTVVFDAGDVATAERRGVVEERWEAVVGSVPKDGGLRSSYAVWLENNASTFAEPTPEEIAAGLTTAVFIGFVAWDGVRYDSHLVEELCANLAASLPSPNAGNEPPVFSRKAVRLAKHTQPSRRSQHTEPAGLRNSLASILKPDPTRQCCADIGNDPRHAHKALDRSRQDARGPARLFPAPRGRFECQGELFEGNILPLEGEPYVRYSSGSVFRWRSSLGPANECHVVDIVWMRLKAGGPKTRAARSRRELIEDTSCLPELVGAYGALGVDNESKMAVVIVWENQRAREAAKQQFERILLNFPASSINLPAPHVSFPMSHGSSLDNTESLEWTCFHVPPGALARRLFDMTSPSEQAGIPTACWVASAGEWQPTEASEDRSQTFTMVMRWASPAAKAEWYEELFRLSRESYELFG
ncbi:hypothetical protein C8A05DRAFT_39827, partial [Staphylotrichum tortipilum]